MLLTIWVGLAAAAGATCRYLTDQIVQHQHDTTLPVGTFVINVSGSFVLGLVTGLATHHGLPKIPTTVVGVGFAGGFTTWSTFMWETLALAETGALWEVTLNLLASIGLGLAAAAAGLGLALL